MKKFLSNIYVYIQASFVFVLLSLGYVLRHFGYKTIDLNKSLNYFGFGTSDSEPRPLNKDIKLKYEGKK